jgi:ribosomal protein S18 acetylase RimI-like enzyme
VDIELLPANLKTLTELSIIPISFEVKSVFRVELVKGGLGGIRLREEPVSHPYVKDYDARDGEGPTRWLRRFDTNNWVVLLARQKGTAIGGGALVTNSPGIDMLRRRQDLAVLWDLRVRPEFRGQGTGTELFRRAAQLARDKECTQLSVETQNVNVPACKFYRKQRCTLGEIGRFQYVMHDFQKDEVMLVWYLDLTKNTD